MAYEFYVSIEGTKQGKFKGESLRDKWKDKVVGLSFFYEVKTALDVASGQALGKRQHLPVRFIKQWGASSPQFFQALVTNEAIKSVLFEFVKTDSKGIEYVFQIIKLSNAIVSNYRPYIVQEVTNKSDPHELEEVSFVFQHIEIRNRLGLMTSDDWKRLS